MERHKVIASVYAQIPDVECKGLCTQFCGPIGCSGAEAQAMQENGVALPVTRTSEIHGPLTCSHLSEAGKCRIYEHRPFVCRIFGAVRRLPCPHGCKPKGGFVSAELEKQLLATLDAASDAPSYWGSPLRPGPGDW